MKVWIDLENTPHTVFFRPVVRRLKEKGHEVFITAKDFGQTIGLLELFDIPYTAIGRGVGQNQAAKVLSVLQRALMLLKVVKHQNIQVSISHGSRSHILSSFFAHIPSITAYDYEYSSKTMVHELTSLVLVPAILKESPYFYGRTVPSNLRFYPGLKEELYLCDFIPPDSPIISINPNSILVVIRPSATMAHYTDPRAVKIFDRIMDRVTTFRKGELAVVLLPRTRQQKDELIQRFKDFRKSIIIPEAALDGLSLLWQADLVISAGGTMNRESALLGIPTYSIFTGPTGAVDQYLINSGCMKQINLEYKVDEIIFKKKDPIRLKKTDCKVLDYFLEQIELLPHE